MAQVKTHSVDRTAQIRKYERFVNERLKVDLQRTLDARDKIYDTISE